MRTELIGLGLARIKSLASAISSSSSDGSKPSEPGRSSRAVSTQRMIRRSDPSNSHSCQHRRLWRSFPEPRDKSGSWPTSPLPYDRHIVVVDHVLLFRLLTCSPVTVPRSMALSDDSTNDDTILECLADQLRSCRTHAHQTNPTGLETFDCGHADLLVRAFGESRGLCHRQEHRPAHRFTVRFASATTSLASEYRSF